MIITVEGRPLNGPLMKNSNTLKDPLMKGGSIKPDVLASRLGHKQDGATNAAMHEASQDMAQSRAHFEPYDSAAIAAMHAAQKVKQAAEQAEKAKEVSQQAEVTQSSEKAKEIPTLFSAVSTNFNKHLGEIASVDASQPPSNEEISNFKKLIKATTKDNILHGKTLLSFITFTWILNMCGLRTVALIWYYIWYYFIKFIYYLFVFFVLFVIFNICLIIIMVIQKSLNISHAVVGGIANGMQTAIDKAGFRIFGKDIKFLGFLQGPTNKVKAADNKIPRTARQVIEAIVYAFFEPYLK